jgi:hypothetical protein
MTEHSFEYKALRFLNDRIELYDISEHDLRTALFDIPQNEYAQGVASLREIGYIKNKDLYEKGISITTQGQVKLQQLQKIVDSERKGAESDSENTSPIHQLPTGIKRYFLINGNSYTMGSGTFWVALPIICSLAFFLGTIKYDADKIALVERKAALEDTIRVRDSRINQMRHFSDSALDILSRIPYSEMTLDTQSFRKVQTTIENAGAVLYLNK